MAEPKDMIVPMIKELRGEMRGGFEQIECRLETIELRLSDASARWEADLERYRRLHPAAAAVIST